MLNSKYPISNVLLPDFQLSITTILKSTVFFFQTYPKFSPEGTFKILQTENKNMKIRF